MGRGRAGSSAKRVILVGDSAGGNLVAAVTLRVRPPPRTMRTALKALNRGVWEGI